MAWWLLLANVFWTIAYDTEYAMVDKEDDLKIGIKTSAITFGRYDVAAVMLCYVLFVGLMAWIGGLMSLSWPYFIGLVVASLLAAYHYSLIHTRERMLCFKAFLHNHWVGAAVFAGTLVALL